MNVVVAVSPSASRTYVAHLGRVAVGVKVSKFGSEGGVPCLSHYGSWRRQIRFSGFLANTCSAEIVVAWPLAQFSSCTNPTACGGILICYSHHGGVSRVGRSSRIRVVVEGLDLDSFRAVGVAGLVGGTAVGTADRGVGAGWASLAGRDRAWVVFGLVGFGADSAAVQVSAQGGVVAIALAVAALGASSI